MSIRKFSLLPSLASRFVGKYSVPARFSSFYPINDNVFGLSEEKRQVSLFFVISLKID